MSGPTVTATIMAQDFASAVIQRLATLAKDTTENTARLSARSARDSGADMARLTAQHSAAVESMSQRMGVFAAKVDKAMAGAFAGLGGHFLHETMAVGAEMSRIERRTMAFTAFTKKQMEEIRTAADTTMSGGPGGPQGAMEAARALGMSGVRGDQIAGILPSVALHADETGHGQAESAESLIGLASMIGAFRDAAGKVIPLASATPEQAAAGARKTESMLISVNMVAPGQLQNVVDALKFAAPTTLGLNRPLSEILATYTALAEKGIRGAEAGNTIRSVESRMAAPTAKARAAIATGGLNINDYVKINPDLMDEAGIEKGLSQRIGAEATAKIHGALQNALTALKAGGSAEDYQAKLTEALVSSGSKSMQNRVVAGNLSRDTLGNFVETIDLPRFLKDAAEKGLGPGFLNAVFGKEMGGRLSAILGDHVEKLKAQYDAELNIDRSARAQEERRESYDGRLAELTGAVTGLKDRMFQPMSEPLGEVYHGLAERVRELSSTGAGIRTVMDSVLVGGTAIAGLKTAGTLAEWAGALSKLATGAEAAGPFIGALAVLADIPFAPAVAGLAAITAGIEAFVHRGELWNAFEHWKNGDVEPPTNPEDVDALRARVQADRQEIEARRATLDQSLPLDPTLERLQQHLDGLTKLSRIDQMPGVRDALTARDAAERERPQSDPAVLAARDQLQTLQDQLRQREGITSPRIEGLRRYIEQHQAEDPNAGDIDLERLKARRSDVRAAMPHGVATSPELDVLNDRILHREQFNRSQLDDRLRAALRLIEENRDVLGAPKVSPADVDAAKARLDAVRVEAQQRHDSELEKAKADLAKARLDAEAVVRQTPAAREAQAQVDARRDELRAAAARTAGVDPKIRDLEADIRRNQAAVDAYDRFHPAFTRMGVDGRPMTSPDYGRASVPRTGMTFGFDGPASAEPSRRTARAIPATEPVRPAPVFLDPQYAPAAFRPNAPTAPAAPAAPTKVDVNGTVQGTAELHSNVQVELRPSPYFLGVMQTLQEVAVMTMRGKLGMNMEGSNAVQPVPRLLHASGIGHM